MVDDEDTDVTAGPVEDLEPVAIKTGAPVGMANAVEAVAVADAMPLEPLDPEEAEIAAPAPDPLPETVCVGAKADADIEAEAFRPPVAAAEVVLAAGALPAPAPIVAPSPALNVDPAYAASPEAELMLL